MLKRYPHIGTIKITIETDNGTSTPDVTNQEFNVKGRFEISSQQKSKFYCKINAIQKADVEGQVFIFEGKEYSIVQFQNHQKYCEIWLE